MTNSIGNPPNIKKEEMDKKLTLIERANTTSVLMAQLCKELGLDPKSTTHNAFVLSFSDLQKRSLEYQKELQDMYISASSVKEKVRKPRKTAVEKELEAWEEFPERTDIPISRGDDYGSGQFEHLKTDSFQNGDYK